MLQQIQIKNFTLIESLSLEFNEGTTVITGETGAGKSILLDALSLALGERGSAEFIRSGCDRAEIAVNFSLHKIPEAKKWLQSKSVDVDNECLIRRIIHRDGRSRCFINDTPITLQTIKSLVPLLINIHGQHQYQLLLQRPMQLKILDHYAGTQDSQTKILEHYDEWKRLENEINALEEEKKTRDSRGEFLRFQLEELIALDLGENEIEALHVEHKTLSHSEDLLHHYHHTLALLHENEGTDVNASLHSAIDALLKIEKITLQTSKATALLQSALIQVEEAVGECHAELDIAAGNPERLQWLEQRLSTAHDIARKHHTAPENLYALTQNLQDELSSLDHCDEKIESLRDEQGILEKEYHVLAKKISIKRRKSIKTLDQEVTHQIQQLSMPKGKFITRLIDLPQNFLSPTGYESIEFCVSANPGTPPKPLQKVASGGELSRISLALHVITSEHLPAPTMVFDEVDVGIGGHTGDIVGSLLRNLGEKSQTLCITHLPQVASKGHHHLHVHKDFDKNQTTTSIHYISENDRINEIARMIGGKQTTSTPHAKEMLECGES
jgi:DNA repair protein RecN (Recombination protein N)